jgi:hypothetical protein
MKTLLRRVAPRCADRGFDALQAENARSILPGALRVGAHGRATRNREFAKMPENRQKIFKNQNFLAQSAARR